jgi:hypothetical protein
MFSTCRNTICTETPLIVDMKKETEIMSGLVAPLLSFLHMGKPGNWI